MPEKKLMTADELVSELAAQLRVSKSLVRRLLAELASTARQITKTRGVFVLPGIGRLMKVTRKKRIGKNPQTGPPIKDNGITSVRFRVASSFESRLQGRKKERPDVKLIVRERAKGEHFKEDGKIEKSIDDARVESSDAYAKWHPGVSYHYSIDQRILSEPASPTKREYKVVRIFYATDRNVTPGERLRFGSRRNPSGMLSLGTCDVSIPESHKIGSIERPSILRFELREDSAKHFVIQDVTMRTADQFYSELSVCVQESSKKEAFVFIHGFRVSFDDAVYRTAQISHDLDFRGAPILYSWPSNGRLYDYTPDLNNSENTADNLKGFLEDVASRSGATVIHLIAHSMGNRALTTALEKMSLACPSEPPRFNQIVLTAPDIDADIFTRMAKYIQKRAERMTLYVSSRDVALIASKRKNGSYPRAGDCSERVVIVEGVDTVDATAVDTNLIGHFYYAENRSVLSDIFNLLDTGTAPDGRFGIRPVTAIPPYWRFAP